MSEFPPQSDPLPEAGQVTRLLSQISAGDPQASEALLPLVYEALRRLARSRMAGERPGHTLQPTALVHEAYLRLVGGDENHWDNRGHFFTAAAEAMRRILIERARAKSRLKRGGGNRTLSLDGVEATVESGNEADLDELLHLNQALDRLEAIDPDMVRVVKLRFFAGLTVEETAEVLDISLRTVYRQSEAARAWIRREMSREATDAPRD